MTKIRDNAQNMVSTCKHCLIWFDLEHLVYLVQLVHLVYLQVLDVNGTSNCRYEADPPDVCLPFMHSHFRSALRNSLSLVTFIIMICGCFPMHVLDVLSSRSRSGLSSFVHTAHYQMLRRRRPAELSANHNASSESWNGFM